MRVKPEIRSYMGTSRIYRAHYVLDTQEFTAKNHLELRVSAILRRYPAWRNRSAPTYLYY